MLNQLVEWEREAFLWLNDWHTPYGDAFFYLFTSSHTWMGVWLLLALLCFYKQPAKEGILVVIALLFSLLVCDQLTSHLIKPLCMRPRPTHYPAIQGLVQVVYEYRGGQYGFVSGHSANYFSLAMFTSLLFRNRRYSFFIFLVAALIAYSRIYIGVHFITDVIPGAIIGMLIGSLAYYFYEKVRIGWVEGARSTPAHKVFAPMCRRWLTLLAVFLVFLLSVSFTVMKATARLMS